MQLRAHEAVAEAKPIADLCIELIEVGDAEVVDPPAGHDLLHAGEAAGVEGCGQGEGAIHVVFGDAGDGGEADANEESDAGECGSDVELAASTDHGLEAIVERTTAWSHARLPVIERGASAGMPQVLRNELDAAFRTGPERPGWHGGGRDMCVMLPSASGETGRLRAAIEWGVRPRGVDGERAVCGAGERVSGCRRHRDGQRSAVAGATSAAKSGSVPEPRRSLWQLRFAGFRERIR